MNPTSSKRKRDPNSFNDEPYSSTRPMNDVFINYSSEDIGKSFISHLRKALLRNNFAIADHTMLPLGQDMNLELLKAIKGSDMYVVVFSPKYASSKWCLDELVDIMDHLHKIDERKVIPVFYKVEPSDVRSQTGPFLEPFQAHQTNNNLDPESVLQWRQALSDAGHLSGLTLQNRDEAELVSEIVEELLKMQRPQDLYVTDHPVGIGIRAEELISTLRLDQKDCVLVVAVFGISGIGKTTIVKEAYNRISQRFHHPCFLDIDYISQVPNWKVTLQNELISCLTHGNKYSIMSNHNEGVSKIRKLVSRQKILLVLDGVDNFQQLESLGIDPKWLYKGSRIIVTTRDKRSLGNIPYAPYQTKLLNKQESLSLFTRLMYLRDNHVNQKFIKEVVGRAGGLPMVLKMWSSHFQHHEREEWPNIMETLKGIPHGDVQKQLQMSYDSLYNRARKLFLDIACFFNGMEKDIVVKILQDEDSRFFPNIEIRHLVDKSLVEITSDCELWTHHAIREMGHEIVRQVSEDEPGQRNRLLDPRDVKRVLTECSGTESIESIRLELFKNMPEVTLEALKKMRSIRLLHLFYPYSIFSHDETTHLCFAKLKYMLWYKFPFKSLNNIEICNVVVLELTESKLETLGEGLKSLKKLRILNVSSSRLLTKTGNFSGLENLEELYFGGCMCLEELHSSIGSLQKLAILDLSSSIPLKRIPWEMIGKLASLQKLVLGSTDHGTGLEPGKVNDLLLNSLNGFPIKTLELYGCNISGGVVSLPRLQHLYLSNVEFSCHPDTLLGLHELNTIELKHCKKIQSIPNLPGNITSINVDNCSRLANLPPNISQLKSLTDLYFYGCPKLGTQDPHFLMKITQLTNLTHLTMFKCGVSQVPNEIGDLVSLKELDLSYNTFSRLPDTLSNLSQLLYINIECCQQFRLLPLLPSNLTNIQALGCDSFDVMSSSFSTKVKVCKDSPFSNRFMFQFPWEDLEVPDWCGYQSQGNILSCVAPMHLNKICGIILCANTSEAISDRIFISKMYNKTKNTSHHFKTDNAFTPDFLEEGMLVMSYPLDNTTLSVKPGDSVVLKLLQGSVLSCGLRFICESDVVDGNLVIQTVTEPYPHGGDCFLSDDEDYSYPYDEDWSSSDDEDELWYDKYK